MNDLLEKPQLDNKQITGNMEKVRREDIESKIKNLEEESNPWNNPQNLERVSMLQCCVTKDDETTIATYNIATCVGLAIAAKDENNVVHRIVSHYPYTHPDEHFPKNELREYLEGLGHIKDIKAIMCSMDSFENFDNLDEREEEILNEFDSIFQFYKNEHPEFSIPFKQSWYIKVSPQGEFEYADTEEMIKIYKELLEEERKANEQRYKETLNSEQ